MSVGVRFCCSTLPAHGPGGGGADVCVGGGQRRQVRVQRGRLVQPLERLAQRDDAVAETQAIVPRRRLVHWFTGGFGRAAGK